MSAAITSHMMTVLREHDRYHAALVDLAGDYGCTVRRPPDPSQPPEGMACRDRRPDDSAEWCYACVASAALEGPV